MSYIEVPVPLADAALSLMDYTQAQIDMISDAGTCVTDLTADEEIACLRKAYKKLERLHDGFGPGESSIICIDENEIDIPDPKNQTITALTRDEIVEIVGRDAQFDPSEDNEEPYSIQFLGCPFWSDDTHDLVEQCLAYAQEKAQVDQWKGGER